MIPLYHYMVYGMHSFILVEQKEWEREQGWPASCGRVGWGPRLGMCRYRTPRARAPGPAAGGQCDMELKIVRLRDTVNPKQVSFVIPTNISVVVFSRTVICGWLSSSWLPKSHYKHTHASARCLSSSALRPLRMRKTKWILVSIREQQRDSENLKSEAEMNPSAYTSNFLLQKFHGPFWVSN